MSSLPIDESMPARSYERVCASDELVNEGAGVRFDVSYSGETVCAFVLRFRGQVHGYLNRCQHLPMEMDWQPGQFLDSSKRWILCATHGAAYEPDTGLCIAGPCNRAKLIKLKLEESQGEVRWYPEGNIRSVFAD